MKKESMLALGLMGIIGLLSLGVIKANDAGGIEGENNQLTAVEKGPTLRSIGDAQLNWTEGEDFFTISIARPDGVTDDGPAGFTIMDRNLGATTNDIMSEDSYGYKYQWGNNYGFADSEIITPITDGLEWDDNYNNSGYYSTDFVNNIRNCDPETGDCFYDYDVWSNSSHHDGVWGGENDAEVNNWGLNLDNPTDRRGPCPSGYHVPSAGEWNKLLEYRAKTNESNYPNGINGLDAGSLIYAEACETTYICYDENDDKVSCDGEYEWRECGTYESLGNDFANYFRLPFAGYRDYNDASLYNQGSRGLYWSSSPFSSSTYPNFARTLDLASSNVDANDYDLRALGYSVRCFKDSYVAPTTYSLTFNSQGGSEVDTGEAVQNGTRSRPANPTRDDYIFVNWYTSTGYETVFDFSTPATENLTVYAKWKNEKDIILEATATEANQKIKINKYFANAYTVDRGDGSPVETVSSDKTHTYSVASGYTITLSLTGGATRWTFRDVYEGLVPWDGTTLTGVKITSMPSLSDGFGDGATEPGDNFFAFFNGYGVLTSLPEGSFDTSNILVAGDGFFKGFNIFGGLLTSLPSGSFNLSGITTVGNNFFRGFNEEGELISLPEGSFDTSNITAVGNDFFYTFNEYGKLASLPTGSFNLSGITVVGDDFFGGFNYGGALTSLPAGSFNTSNIETVGNNFFNVFNYLGELVSLPAGSFDTSSIKTVGNQFFSAFNWRGALTSLSTGSFNLSGITTVGDDFFTYFNYEGALTSLPTGSFNTSNIKTVGNNFFYFFNEAGELESLPAGSFDISNIETVGNNFFGGFNGVGKLTNLPSGSFRLSTGLTTVGDYFFDYFNGEGALTSLPAGSFKTENITTAGDFFFSSFNYNGKLTSLPEGSFDTSNILVAGDGFFVSFNGGGALEILPDSFTISSVGASTNFGYYAAFNSPNHTINRKVSDLVSGVTAPLDDRNTFSDNQPGRCGVHENWLETPETACSDLDIILEATATEANQKLKISKYFANAYTVDWGDGSPVETVSADKTHTYATAGTYTITLSTTVDRWTFQNLYKPLVPTNGTTMTGVKITYMPSLAEGFGENATNPGDFFFYYFNNQGALTSLPDGSFDTSNITGAGNGFFYSFNSYGKITSLPVNSFDTSNIITAGNNFFSAFNMNGQLISLPDGSFRFATGLTTAGFGFFSSFNRDGAITSLPEKSFDTSKITTVGDNFFYCFNREGKLTSLPENSFNISNISGTVGDYFFRSFNEDGALTSLPDGSFDTSNITGAGKLFFYFFNSYGKLTSLPENSFNISNISGTVGDYFFTSFNKNGALTSLPEGSFDTSKITAVGLYFFSAFNQWGTITNLPVNSFNTSKITTVGDDFFSYFNYVGKITSLPEGSFDTSSITTAGNEFFSLFNAYGELTSLPENSFNTSKITTVGDDFFSYFNLGGELASLPENSFDTSSITTAGDRFFSSFNSNGKLASLPDSFKLSSVGASENYGYYYAFTPSYTLNKKVSDLVSGVTVPLNDMNTFSDNQPGRCGVHENRLQTTADACSITYDDGLGGTGEFKYAADTTGVEVGSGMVVPSRSGYTLSGWNEASGNNVDEVKFPDMDGQTLYANWIPDEYTITFVDGSGTEADVIYTGAYESTVTAEYPEWTKIGYTIHWDKVIPDTMPLSGDIITASWTINQYTLTIDVDGTLTVITGDYGSPVTPPANPSKNGYKFVGWEPEIPATMPAEDMTIKAKWEKINSGGGSSGGGGGGGGGGSSSSSGSTSTGSNTSQPTGSGANNSTGTQNDQTTTGTNIKEPEGTGNKAEIQTGSQEDPSQQVPQNDSNIQDSSAEVSEGQTYSEEFQQAYEFAKGKGITTMPTIQKAQMNSPLTRIAMAKMLSQYAINILGKKPANIIVPKFKDVTKKMDSDYDDGVTLAYQLGIMGQNMPGNNFRPDDEVTRAEFATALSRMIYGTSDGIYKSTSEYYVNHMKKLKEEGIITKDDPKMKELRGYVMIMLMRSAK